MLVPDVDVSGKERSGIEMWLASTKTSRDQGEQNTI